MNSFSDLDPTQDQIMRNLDKLRKAAVSRREFGVNMMDRCIPSAELTGRELKPKGEIAKVRHSKKSSSSIDRHQVVESLMKAGPTKVKSESGGRTAALQADSQNCQEFVPYSKKPAKFVAGSQEEASSTNNCGRSPSRSKRVFRKAVPVKVVVDSGAREKSATNDSRYPVRSGPLLSVQPKATKEKDPEESQKRSSMSTIYEKAMKLAEGLPRGITVRPSGKWVSLAQNFLFFFVLKYSFFNLSVAHSKSRYTMRESLVTWVSSNPSSMPLQHMSWHENVAGPSKNIRPPSKRRKTFF